MKHEHIIKLVILTPLDNLDEMILQFSGREGELIKTLQTMQEQDVAQEVHDINEQHIAMKPDGDIDICRK